MSTTSRLAVPMSFVLALDRSCLRTLMPWLFPDPPRTPETPPTGLASSLADRIAREGGHLVGVLFLLSIIALGVMVLMRFVAL